MKNFWKKVYVALATVVTMVSSEWYIIKAENSGKCLNVDGGGARDGTNITLWQRTDKNQTFRFFVLDVYYAKKCQCYKCYKLRL